MLFVILLKLDSVRSTSSISVPRPGPTSMICTFSLRPCASHSAYSHIPISSPNTWLISGDVTKSPLVPN